MTTRIELAGLADRYDLVIVGGGITGAGILREAVRTGARVLLVEQRDFASGTSSWSSKLVHGGLRYLKNGQWRLTLESVRERQRLMREAPGLVEPQRFIMPIYRGIKPGKWLMRIGLWIYDLMAGSWRSRWLDAAQVVGSEPELRLEKLQGAVSYEDARTNDTRLVLRLIFDAVALGGTALNYVQAELLHDGGCVRGVRLRDEVGNVREIAAGVVVNATGAWAADLPGAPECSAPALRPLRGSHLVFAATRLPVSQAVSWLHPKDQRPVFAYPWEGAVVYGTTDLDHADGLDGPRMNVAEGEYLIEGLLHQFPNLNLRLEDALCSYAGVRPVVASGKGDPSAESRESAMWSSPGLVGITGGKLTTFRVTARQVLAEAARQLPILTPGDSAPVFEAHGRAQVGQERLYGCYGSVAAEILREATPDELAMIGSTPYCRAELRWSLRHERVHHLDDLLMRRTRIGLVMPQGGSEMLSEILDLCWAELGWDESRCAREEQRYRDYWREHHAVTPA